MQTLNVTGCKLENFAYAINLWQTDATVTISDNIVKNYATQGIILNNAGKVTRSPKIDCKGILLLSTVVVSGLKPVNSEDLLGLQTE